MCISYVYMKEKLIRKEYTEGYPNIRSNLYFAKCFRCKHEWIPRVENIKTCAKCRSPYWDKAKNEKQYNQMRLWAANIVQNAKRRGFIGKPDFHKCKDCGKKATKWDHRNYGRPLIVEPVCHSCNIKRSKTKNI